VLETKGGFHAFCKPVEHHLSVADKRARVKATMAERRVSALGRGLVGEPKAVHVAKNSTEMGKPDRSPSTLST